MTYRQAIDKGKNRLQGLAMVLLATFLTTCALNSRAEPAARMAEIESLYRDANAVFARDGMPGEVNRILDLIGPVDSVAMPEQWFKVEYLRLREI